MKFGGVALLQSFKELKFKTGVGLGRAKASMNGIDTLQILYLPLLGKVPRNGQLYAPHSWWMVNDAKKYNAEVIHLQLEKRVS